MPQPDKHPKVATPVPEAFEEDIADVQHRGHHQVFGSSAITGNSHIDKSCVVRQNIYCGKALEGSAFQVHASSYGDPQDPQYDPEHIYHSTISAGFVKNDADGNFLFGQAGDGMGATMLDELTDVDLSTVAPSSGDHLEYNGSQWVPADPSHTAEVNDLSAAVTWVNVPEANITELAVTQHEAALSITESQISDLGAYAESLGELSDVTLTSPAEKNVLQYVSGVWVNRANLELGLGATLTLVDSTDDIQATIEATFDGLVLNGDEERVIVAADNDFMLEGSNAAFFMGSVVEGAWRFLRVGNDLEVQRYESSSWVVKGSFTP